MDDLSEIDLFDLAIFQGLMAISDWPEDPTEIHDELRLFAHPTFPHRQRYLSALVVANILDLQDKHRPLALIHYLGKYSYEK